MSGKCSTFFGAASGGSTPSPLALPTCYSIGACAFSEVSYLVVTKYVQDQQSDCTFSQTATTDNWLFDSRTATTMRWELDADNWVEWNGDTGLWTYVRSDEPVTTGGASIGCFNQQESHPSSQSCSGATFYIKINGVVYPTISWTVQKNSCIPNIAV